MAGLRNVPTNIWIGAKSASKRILRRTPGLKRLVAMWDRMAVLEQSMAVLRSSLQSKIMSLEGRLDQRGRSTNDSIPGMTAAALEFLLAHSRLPAPPSRILDLAGILESGGLDLKGLGYRIDRQSAGDGAWAAVLCRPNSGSELDAAIGLLRPGGRLILSVPLAAGQSPPEWLSPVSVNEVVRARREGGRWTFADTTDAAPAPSLLLGVVERP